VTIPAVVVTPASDESPGCLLWSTLSSGDDLVTADHLRAPRQRQLSNSSSVPHVRYASVVNPLTPTVVTQVQL